MEFTLRLAEVLFDGRLVRLQFTAPISPSTQTAPDWRPAALERLHATANGIPLEPLGAMCVDWTVIADNQWQTPSPRANLQGDFAARVEYLDSQGRQLELSSIYADQGSHEFSTELATGSAWNLRFPYPVPPGQTARVYLSNNQADYDSFRLIAENLPPGTDSHTIESGQTTNGGPPPAPVTCWVFHGLVPEGQILTHGNKVDVQVPAALLRDSDGNSTPAASLQALNRSIVGPDGFTAPELGRNQLAIHVSASHGDDQAPGSPTRPVRTVVRAFQLLLKAAPAPATIRLLRGDHFQEAVWRPHWKPNQLDLLVIEDYWHDHFGADPNTRPVVSASSKKPPINWHGGHARLMGPILIRRIHWQAGRTALVTGARAFILDDCVFERSPLAVQPRDEFAVSEVVLIRCSLIDAENNGGRGHVQGLFCHNVRRVTLSQCLVDRCGYLDREFRDRDIFSHNLYMQNSVGEVAMWGCWVMRGGSHGIQIRSNGLVARCVFNRNALAAFLFRSGTLSQLLITQSDDISPKLLRGLGPELGNSSIPAFSQRIEGCLLVHSVGGRARAIVLGDPNKKGSPPHNLKEIRHNLVLDFGRVFQVNGIGRESRIHHNVLNAIDGDTVYAFKNIDEAALSHLAADFNVYSLPDRATFFTAAPLTSRDDWVRSGRDQHSTFQRAPSTTSRYSLADYARSQDLGQTEAILIATLRARKPGEWSERYTTSPVYEAFLENYRPTEPLTLDSGPWSLLTGAASPPLSPSPLGRGPE